MTPRSLLLGSALLALGCDDDPPAAPPPTPTTDAGQPAAVPQAAPVVTGTLWLVTDGGSTAVAPGTSVAARRSPVGFAGWVPVAAPSLVARVQTEGGSPVTHDFAADPSDGGSAFRLVVNDTAVIGPVTASLGDRDGGAPALAWSLSLEAAPAPKAETTSTKKRTSKKTKKKRR